MTFITTLLAATALVACTAPELHTIDWRTVAASRDQRLLTISYAADQCQTFDHAEVGYYENRLVVTLFVRRNVAACMSVRFLRSVTVFLHESLAGRQVEDGSREKTN